MTAIWDLQIYRFRGYNTGYTRSRNSELLNPEPLNPNNVLYCRHIPKDEDSGRTAQALSGLRPAPGLQQAYRSLFSNFFHSGGPG